MTKFPLFILWFLICPSLAMAQLIAGDVPSGNVVTELNIELEISTPQTGASALLDLNFDGEDDLYVYLNCGATAVDIPNGLLIENYRPTLYTCLGDEGENTPDFTVTYDFGEQMLCDGMDTTLISTELFSIASVGSFMPFGFPTATDKYLYYDLNGQIGWIHLSWDIEDGGDPSVNPIFVNIHSFLSPIGVNTEEVFSADQEFEIYPNPALNDAVTITSNTEFRNLDLLVYNALGELVSSRKIAALPASLDVQYYSSGLHFLSFMKDGESIAQKKLLVNK